MFVDTAKIKVTGGDGGNGMVAFRREKYVPDGGPAGGNGGHGGNIVLEVDDGLRTLIDFRFQKQFQGFHGVHGKSKSMHGRNASHKILKVPPGTVVIDEITKEKLCDLEHHGQQYIVAKGGRGGRGNIAFATSKDPAPYIAENGEPGQERMVILELMLLADVGFVGFPSVGKSTLLSLMTAAKPKIAAYHFTTLSPQLGVAQTQDDRSFVIADLPGLIEGAHLGHGLGLQFLKHIERTKIVAHVVDMGSVEGRDPFDDYQKMKLELSSYNPELLERKQIIVANKMDIPDSDLAVEKFTEKLRVSGETFDIVEVSGVTGYGIEVLKLKLANLLDEVYAEEKQNAPISAADETTEPIVYTVENQKKRKQKAEDIVFEVIRLDNGDYRIESAELIKIYRMTNKNYNESLMRFVHIMRKAGVEHALRKKGARQGDTVWLDDFAFEFVDEFFD